MNDPIQLKDQMLEVTRQAISQIKNPRYFHTERGYQGHLYCCLLAELENIGILSDDLILEMEYQKIDPVHSMTQRPDIILHIPREVTGAQPEENNVCVWALKRHAYIGNAREDFEKLDLMFRNLLYPVGIFINIDSRNHFLEGYIGDFPERIIGIAVDLQEDILSINSAFYTDGELTRI